MMTWIDNIYQKFESMIQEVEDTMLEDFQYLENQMSIVGESVQKFYSTAMEDMLPPSTTSAPVLPIGHYAGISEESIQRIEKQSDISLDSGYYVKADMFKSGAEPQVESADIGSNVGSDISLDSGYYVKADKFKSGAEPQVESADISLDSGYYVKADKFKSGAEPQVESPDIGSNVGSDVNLQNTEMSASETAIEATVAKTASAEVTVTDCSNETENASSVAKTASAEVTVTDCSDETENASSVAKTASAEVTVTDCSDETENASSEQNHSVVEVLVESAEEKEENMSSSSSDIFENAIGFPMIKAIMQQDDDSKLDQTCVLISKDELQFAPNATVNLKASEKKWLQPFSLIKQSARKQEYEKLALLHGKDELGNDDYIKSICPTMREDIFEHEWELL